MSNLSAYLHVLSFNEFDGFVDVSNCVNDVTFPPGSFLDAPGVLVDITLTFPEDLSIVALV